MRRKAIKVLLIAIAIIILGGAITLYLIGKPAKVNTDKKLNGVSDELCSVLYYASLAANSHNIQSWTVKLDVREQRIMISIDAERTLEIVDPEYREIYISLGCYIEALAFAFDAYGYNVPLRQSLYLGFLHFVYEQHLHLYRLLKQSIDKGYCLFQQYPASTHANEEA